MPTSPTQPILDHIATVIRPALRKYLAAEKALTEAVLSPDARAIEAAREDVKLAARQAVDVPFSRKRFRAERPDVPVVYISGEQFDPERCVPGSVFLAKPYQHIDILSACLRLRGK